MSRLAPRGSIPPYIRIMGLSLLEEIVPQKVWEILPDKRHYFLYTPSCSHVSLALSCVLNMAEKGVERNKGLTLHLKISTF